MARRDTRSLTTGRGRGLARTAACALLALTAGFLQPSLLRADDDPADAPAPRGLLVDGLVSADGEVVPAPADEVTVVPPFVARGPVLTAPATADVEAVLPGPMTRAVRCPVLYTHEVPSQVAFRTLLAHLRSEGYRPTSLASVDEALQGRRAVPEGCLVLSFDDALASQFRNALPVLAEVHAPAVFFAMPAFADGAHRYMTARELRWLVVAGHEVMAHTCNHPSLPALLRRDRAAFLAEIHDCRAMLEEITKTTVPYLAYPNGATDAQVQAAVAEEGFRAAFSTAPGTLLSPAGRFALPRIAYTLSEAPSAVVERIHQAGG